MEENRASCQPQGDGIIITQDSLEETTISQNGDINTLFANNFPNPRQISGEGDEERQYSQQSALIAQQKKRHTKSNTEKALNPKIEEFKAYLEAIYKDTHPTTYHLVNPEKVFGFMFYQANRVKKVSKKGSGLFDKEDFELTLTYTDDDSRNVIGEQSVNQYICAIRNYAQDQFDSGLIRFRREDLMSGKLKDLIKGVKNRTERVMKKQFKERVTDDFEPYRCLGDLPKIEEYIWDAHKCTKIYGANGLRDRFQLLFSLSAVLRSDSIYKADLADLCDFKFKQKLEPDPYHIGILRVGEGKTVGSKAQFGKMMRHANVKMCAIGALGFWLMARFMITDEINSIDFTDNTTWFDIKLLCQLGKRNTKNHSKFKSEIYNHFLCYKPDLYVK